MASQNGDIAVYAGDRDDTTTPPKETLHRVNTLPTFGYEVGGVYFVKSENKIYLRTESGWECYDKASEADTATTASQATAIKVRTAVASDARPIPFSALGTASKATMAPALDDNFTYNKTTQTLKVANVEGTATSAKQVENKLTVGSKTYDGSSAVTLTKSDLGLSNVDNTADTDKKIRESNLEWDSSLLTGWVSPIDAAMIPTMGSNRFGFFDPDHIKVEYSTDAGETWIDYGATDYQKLTLVTQDLDYSDLRVGKATSVSERSVNGRLKITFFDFKTLQYNGYTDALYCPLRKFAIDASTDGASDCWCTIRKNTAANPDVFTDVVTKAPLRGWSGWNIINISDEPIVTYINDASVQASKIEFIFGQDSFSSSDYLGLGILKLYAFHETLYAGNNYAKTGNIYTVDTGLSAFFPSWVVAKRGFDSNNCRINNVATPTADTDAANKAYVDSKVGSGSSITTDTAMSSTSTNPVQNKVIKTYIDNLVGTAITQLAAI